MKINRTAGGAGLWMAAILFLTLLASCEPRQRFSATLLDELAPVYPDSRIEAEIRTLQTDAARGSLAGATLLLTGLDSLKPVTVKVLENGSDSPPGISLYRMLDVPVKENTGLDSRTEQFSGQTNPYVVRRAPFRIFEALEPVGNTFNPGRTVCALRIEARVRPEDPEGIRRIAVKISAGGTVRKVNLEIRVWPVEIPPVNKSNLNYVNWLNVSNISKDHQVDPWSAPFYDRLKDYARMMAHGRQNTFWFIWSDFFRFNPDGSVAEFYAERLERYIRTFLDEGLTLIQGAPFCGRRDWSTDAFLVSVPVPGKEIHAVSDEGRALIRSMAGPIIELMANNGWDSRWVQGVFDEPTAEYVERYKSTVAYLKSMKPDLRILEATMTTELSGTVDWWCPQVQEYQKNESFFTERKANGDKVWVYTCLIPGGPWINRLIDQERLRQVYVGWACSKYDLQGFLHWGFNMHGGDAFEELIRNNGGPRNFLPAGDSHIVYPGLSGPLSSQRFEAHRIGMEDYELLNILRKKDPARADQLIAKVFSAFDSYNTDTRTYRETKRELLEAVSGN